MSYPEQPPDPQEERYQSRASKLGDPLTDRQRDIFNYFVTETIRNFYQPTIREVADHFDINLNGVYCHLKAFAKKGLIEAPGQGQRNSRAIKFLRREPLP